MGSRSHSEPRQLTASQHATNAAIYFLGAAVLTLQGIRFGLWLADYHSNVRTWKTVR
jgi:hypothetical protein